MKKHFLFAFAAITALLMTACSEDDIVKGQGGNTVTFSVGVPQLATRAIGEGDSANRLYWGVYDHNNVLLTEISNTAEGQEFSQTGTVHLTLAQDKKYSIVFWAANKDNSMCSVDWNARKMSVEPQFANQESYDAFCAYVEIDNVSGYLKRDVTLYRPFAQLNIGTADVEKAKKSGLTVKNTKVRISGLPKTYDFVTGNTDECEGTFTYDCPKEAVSFEGETFPVDGYEYLAMNYALLSADKQLVEVTFSYIDDDNQQHNRTYTSVPMQRNWRTNIYGNILTSEADFEVTIEPEFNKGSHNVEIVEVATAESLQETINEMEDGDSITIVLTDNIDLSDLFSSSNAPARTRSGESSDVAHLAAGRTLILDLNGKTISQTKKQTAGHQMILNDGNLTINDSKGGGKISYTDSGEGGEYISDAIYNRGVLVINGGTIENLSSATVATNGYPHAVDTYSGLRNTSVTINGGVIYCAEYSAVRMFCVSATNAADLVINGGTIQGAIDMQNGTKDAAVGTLTINDGKFEITRNTNNIRFANWNGGATAYGLTAAIKGGTFNGGITTQYVPAAANWDKRVITGGTFTQDMTEYCVPGYNCNENAAGTYDVVAGSPVAKIGNTEYLSLITAINAVEDGETITLIRDEVFTLNNRTHNSGTYYDGLYYIGDKSFTIDLGRFTIGQNGSVNDYLLNFKNSGSKANTITLKNGTLDAGTTAYCALATSSSNAQKITINTENITFINNNSNGAVLKIRGGSELNVNAGTIIEGKNSYVGIEAVGNNTVVNIYDDAKIYQKGTSSYVGAIVGASYNATMNIYGGYGQSAKCGIIVMSTGATINVSGGEWIANNDGTVAGGNQGVLVSQNNRYESGWACKSVLNVTGGTFKGGYDCYGMGPGVEADDAQINIKGGNFNADPTKYVVAGYEVTGNYTVGKPKALVELEKAIANGGNVTLSGDVTLLESLKIENTIVLDLNGKTITAPLFSAFEVKKGGELTLKNGKVVAYESTVRAIGGKVIVESGEYTSTGTALDKPATYRYSLDCREGGELIINGGTFKSNNGMINVGSTVTINGGKFENIVEKTMTRHFAYVSAPLIINDGEFYGKANSSAGGCFFCGAAAGGDIQVKGGKFTSLWTSGSVNRIFEYYYGGTITVTGGMFNTNGGIATFVTENTDEATKAAYPYVAK